jgi:hypothetical protein
MQRMNNTNLLVDLVSYSLESMLMMLTGYGRHVFHEDLFIVKDFASDKKVDNLFSHGTMKKIEDVIINGWAVGLIEDCKALAITMFFLRTHLHAMNARLEVPHC